MRDWSLISNYVEGGIGRHNGRKGASEVLPLQKGGRRKF